jgi:hypothetical protein
LLAWGYYLGTYGPKGNGVDGIFGDLTDNAVRDFQVKRRLPNTGKTDSTTWSYLKLNPLTIFIVKGDPRAISNFKICAEFNIGSQRFQDWEDLNPYPLPSTNILIDPQHRGATGTAQNKPLCGATGLRVSRNVTEYVGDFVYTQNRRGSAGNIYIRKSDTRTITNLRLHVYFTINGAWHYDFEDIPSPWNSSYSLQIDGRGMCWDGHEWVGDLLRPTSVEVPRSHC